MAAPDRTVSVLESLRSEMLLARKPSFAVGGGGGSGAGGLASSLGSPSGSYAVSSGAGSVYTGGGGASAGVSVLLGSPGGPSGSGVGSPRGSFLPRT
jgi:hypothetical protein